MATADKTKLGESELLKFLSEHPGWRAEDGSIARTYEFKRFLDGIAFVEKVAGAAEHADHHPDIDIRYRKVTLRLTSHDVGGLTPRDPKLASVADELYLA
jgi:4a-hydroxytetrahydrobiopterin dehydratase